MKIASALLVFFIATLIGCATPPADEEEASSESNQAATSSSADVSAAFAIDYGASDSAAGWLVSSGRFDSIDEDDLMKRLPDGAAHAAAVCLADRHDTIHGDTLAGFTWKHEHETYYVLSVALADMNGLEDLHMVFVFNADGTSAFQALTWDGKKNIKLTSGRSACVSANQ